MHGAAQWAAFISLCGGRPFVMAPTTTHFDPAEAWAVASRERVVSMSMVGDAFGRPLVDELESGDYDLSGLLVLVTGGAALSAPLKQRFIELLPHLTHPGRRRFVGIGFTDGPGFQSRAERHRAVRAEPGCGGGQRGHDPDPVAGRRGNRLAGPAGPDTAGLPG